MLEVILIKNTKNGNVSKHWQQNVEVKDIAVMQTLMGLAGTSIMNNGILENITETYVYNKEFDIFMNTRQAEAYLLKGDWESR